MVAESERSGAVQPAQRDRVVELVRAVLGGSLVGCYAHGSAVGGGLRPASDLDVLAVSEAPLDERQRRSLTDGCLALSGMGGELRPVELTVVVREDVVPWRYPPVGDYLFGEWRRAEFEAGAVPERAPMPDLALVITTALEGASPLAGAEPGEVFDAVPVGDVVRASVEGLDELLAEVDTDTRNVVLTVARVWSTTATGRIVAKDEAASWAARRLPDEYVPVVEHARELYLGSTYAEEVWPEPVLARVHACVEWMADEARRTHPPTTENVGPER